MHPDLNLERWAKERPQFPALLAPGREPLSHSELWALLGRTAEELRNSGLHPGEVVALVTGPGAEFLPAFLSIAGEYGCAPLDPSLTASEYRFYLSALGTRRLVIEDGVAPPAILAAGQLGIRVQRIRPALDRGAGAFTLERCRHHAATPPGRQTEAALLLYTSATTGDPKLVPLTPGNLYASVESETRFPPLYETDRLLSLAPLFHLHGLLSVLTQLFCGGSVARAPGLEAHGLPAWLEDFHPTWLTGGPPLLRTILALAQRNPDLFKRVRLRFIRSGGAPADPELFSSLEAAVGAPALDGYGMTEAGYITRSTPGARKKGSVGRTMGAEISIQDESGGSLPPESVGEIALRGAGVMGGYLDNPEANRLAFRNGWFRTGDLGYLDAEGFLYITGRLKGMINRGGEKILPAEVDEAVLRHPAVAEAAAFAIPHRTLGEDVAAAVVLREGASASEWELRRFAALSLAAFKVPRRIVFVDHIPRASTGKPKRTALAAQYRDLSSSRAEHAAPRSATEERLLEIWRRILGVAEIGREDDFFALGGDSLSAAVMLTEVQSVLKTGGGALDRVDFFDRPTIAFLAGLIAEGELHLEAQPAGDQPASRILPFQQRGSRIPLFCFAAREVDAYHQRHLARSLGDQQPFYAVCPPNSVRGKRLLKVEELASLSIAAIQRVQPRGPYILGGHCFGGVLAFEAALQLIAAGETVLQLVLFDVPAPGYPKVGRKWKRYLVEAGRILAGLARRERPVAPREILRHFQRLGRILIQRLPGRARRSLLLLDTRATLEEREWIELASVMLYEYRPKGFPAPILHFIASDDTVSTRILDDPRSGWREFARGGLELFTVRGRHNTLLMAEHAPALAAEVGRVLASGDRAGAAAASL